MFKKRPLIISISLFLVFLIVSFFILINQKTNVSCTLSASAKENNNVTFEIKISLLHPLFFNYIKTVELSDLDDTLKRIDARATSKEGFKKTNSDGFRSNYNLIVHINTNDKEKLKEVISKCKFHVTYGNPKGKSEEEYLVGDYIEGS